MYGFRSINGNIIIISYVNIKNLSLKGFNVIYNVDTNILDLDAQCYTYFIKTRVSEILNLTSFANLSNLNLKINYSKLKEKEDLENYSLQLTCKYKKMGLKTYNYKHFIFNFTILEEIKNSKNANLNFFQTTFNQKINDEIYSHFSLNKVLETSGFAALNKEIKDMENIQNSQSYISKNSFIKENSYFLVFIASVLLLIILAFRW